MASLALPGMSGFIAELMVFVGFATSDAYSLTFRIVTVCLAAIGVILTPIYLLSMLRELLYGPENPELTAKEALIDAEPREVFVIGSLLVPIIGIGLYPKVLTQMYDATTVQLTARLRQAVPSLGETKVAQEEADPEFSVLLLKAAVKTAPKLDVPAIAVPVMNTPVMNTSVIDVPAIAVPAIDVQP